MALSQVVCWFPIIEDFITVLDWTVKCSNDMAGEEDIESNNWLDIC
jgi:hypothetical protein